MLKPERIRQLLAEWFINQSATEVIFKEEVSQKHDPYARYRIAYEAIFEPYRLDQARVEIWVTTEGYIAIGFETWKRIAERLNVKCKSNRFGAGHEPIYMEEPEMFTILELISNGQIAISPVVLPIFGLISTKAVVSVETLKNLISKSFTSIEWLNGVSQNKFNENYLIQFKGWRG